MKEFFKELKKQAEEIDINLNDTQINQMHKYMELMLEWNEKINLTAITEEKEIIQKHFIDSLTIAKYIEKNAKIVDVGTGAGFPGIPLKIVREDLNITLLDSLNKRIKFLDEVINQIGLKDIRTVHARVEEFGKDKEYRENFDYATSRAVANLTTLSEYMLPLVKKCGKCICMKGSNVESELKESKKAIEVLGGTIQKVESFNLPFSDISRNIIIINKIKDTPLKYPRKPGIPSKEPIQASIQ